MNNQETKAPRNFMNMRKLREQSFTPSTSVGSVRLCALVPWLFIGEAVFSGFCNFFQVFSPTPGRCLRGLGSAAAVFNTL